MGQIIHRQGDLFTSDAPAFGHGCNTQGKMGAGIAVGFRSRLPEMYEQYKKLCDTNKLAPGEIFVYKPEQGPLVYNIATQDEPGAHAQIDWVIDGMGQALGDCNIKGLSKLAIPRIGSGLGGLEWDEVEKVLQRMVRFSNCDIEVWTLE